MDAGFTSKIRRLTLRHQNSRLARVPGGYPVVQDNLVRATGGGRCSILRGKAPRQEAA